MSIIDQYVSLNIQLAIGLDQMTIYVFFYFYGIANDAGLLLNEADASRKHPILCFDLTYIYSLLTKG
jgi:hypothetical protein